MDSVHIATLIVLFLGVWRLATLFVVDYGPFNVFAELRHRIGVRYDEHNRKIGTNVVARAFICPVCMGFWIGVLVAILAFIRLDLTTYALLPFAFSGFVHFIEDHLEK